jgi:hypothetical protein
LLNHTKASFAPPPGAQKAALAAIRLKGRPPSTPEANEKRRQAQLGIPKGHGAKISATKRAKRAMR